MRGVEHSIRDRVVSGMQEAEYQHDPGVDHPFIFIVDRRRRGFSLAPTPASDYGHALDLAVPLAPGCADFLAGEKTTRGFAGLGDREFGDHAAGLPCLYARCAGHLSGIEATLFPSRLVALVHRFEPGFPPFIKSRKVKKTNTRFDPEAGFDLTYWDLVLVA